VEVGTTGVGVPQASVTRMIASKGRAIRFNGDLHELLSFLLWQKKGNARRVAVMVEIRVLVGGMKKAHPIHSSF
jgi:hypothetical protein